MQVPEVGPGDDHPMQQSLDLGVRLRADRFDLALVAVPAGLGFEEGPKGRYVPLPEDRAKPVAIRAVVCRHRRGSLGQPWLDAPWFGQAGCGGCPDGSPGCQAACGRGAPGGGTLPGTRVTRTPPVVAPTAL